jgi:prenylcysteine oxidase / farnesylcysteine lyase
MKGPVHSVKGGNRQVALRTCQASSRIIRSTVSVIEALSDQKFRLHTPEGSEDFDLVILAAPLRKDAVNVVFKGFSDFFRPADWIGSYQRTVATLVEGDLNDTFFGSSTPLDSVINVQPGSLWNTVGRLRDVTGNASTTSGYSVWKIFSSSPLSSELLSRMFWRTFGAAQVDWRAYPNYAEPPRSPPPFALSPRLYYLNAIEWAGSAMEMSLISAKNIALAIANDVAAKSPQCSAPASKLQKSDL